MGLSRHLTTILVALSILWTGQSHASNAGSCRDLFASSGSSSVSKVIVSEGIYKKLLINLRATLSGNLATVWRSEWKTKLSVNRSNQFVLDMVEKFLTPETREAVLLGLDPSTEGFVREFHDRLYWLQKEGRLSEKDELLARSPPAPPGAIDRTFTYYTQPLVAGGSGGKHQPRIRTYVRELVPTKMKNNVPVTGFNLAGQSISVTKLSAGIFEVRTENDSGRSVRKVSLAELRGEFGNPLYLVAPHGRNFKLEIKTALRDEISSREHSLLDGDHMVEKLDVGLTWSQVKELFESDGPVLARVEALKVRLISENPKLKPRIDAVFNVLVEGATQDPSFFQIIGATVYNRTAFESTSGFQSTVDREQGVASGNMYNNNLLKNPPLAMRENQFLRNSDENARHVELKVPVTIVNLALGLNFKDGVVELEQPTSLQNQRNKVAIDTFYPYVTSPKHPGKFNFGRKFGR
jgi:hypothetical protein